MYDALQEIADLSESLQCNNMSLPRAHRLILRQIDVFRGRKEAGGECATIAAKATEEGLYHGISLTPGNANGLIKQGQFYQALVDSMSIRLLPSNERALCDAVNVVLPSDWPDTMQTEYGEQDLKTLCRRFFMPYSSQLKQEFREFKDSKGLNVKQLMSRLVASVQTLPISTAACERGFSQMNIVCSDLRSSLTVAHMSSLMFIGIVGPPIHKWNPQSYVESWLASGRRDAT